MGKPFTARKYNHGL